MPIAYGSIHLPANLQVAATLESQGIRRVFIGDRRAKIAHRNRNPLCSCARASAMASRSQLPRAAGHTPHGNCPTVIPTPVNGSSVVCIMADTSYSDMSAQDNRGQAVTEVIAHVGIDDNKVRVHGVTETGRNLACKSTVQMDRSWAWRAARRSITVPRQS